MDGVPPPQAIWDLVTAHAVARCVHVVADLGVADALDGDATVEELAGRTGANRDALGRILRLLAGHGVFAEGQRGYVHTELSELLPHLTEVVDDITIGEPALNFGELMAYFADHPDEAKTFNQAMANKSASVVSAVIEAYDFAPFSTIADVGGGHGHLLSAILDSAPEASGILFDLPHVVAEVKQLASARLSLVSGDFFGTSKTSSNPLCVSPEPLSSVTSRRASTTTFGAGTASRPVFRGAIR